MLFLCGIALYIFVTDSDGRTANVETTIPLNANTDIPISFEFNTQEVNAGDELSVDYTIENCEYIRDAAATWIIRENGEYEEENENSRYEDNFTRVETTTLNSTTGRITYRPNYGDDLFLIIKGYTSTGKAFYAQSERIVIKGGDIAPIEIELVSKDEYAVLGSPYRVSYRVSGGSGGYTVRIDGTLIGVDHSVLGSAVNTSNSAEDELTIVPDNGYSMVLYIYVKDSYGKTAQWETGDIEIKPNPDYPVDCEIVSTGNSITANYSISNLPSGFTGTVLWKIGEHSEWDEYSGAINKEDIIAGSGSTSITPAFGDFVILIISGKVSNGSPIYFASNKIDIIKGRINLPSSLRRIEAESFSGCTFSEIVIPPSVEYIDKEAIPNSCTIICTEETYAYNWAIENGYEVSVLKK